MMLLVRDGRPECSSSLLGRPCRTDDGQRRRRPEPTPKAGASPVFGPVLQVKLTDDQFDQGVLLQHFRLRLHVYRIFGAGRRSGIDIAKVEEILVDALDLDRRLRPVQSRLDGS